MELLFELAKMLWAKSDPLLLVCLLILGYWIHKTDRKLEAHINPNPKDNPSPHPQCSQHEICFDNVLEQLKQNRAAVAVSHDEVRSELQALGGRIDTVLKVAVSRRERSDE
jgi:hypothetical protein